MADAGGLAIVLDANGVEDRDPDILLMSPLKMRGNQNRQGFRRVAAVGALPSFSIVIRVWFGPISSEIT